QGRETLDAAKEDSIREERATIDAQKGEVSDGERVASSRKSGAESTARDPDKAVKREVKKKLDEGPGSDRDGLGRAFRAQKSGGRVDGGPAGFLDYGLAFVGWAQTEGNPTLG